LARLLITAILGSFGLEARAGVRNTVDNSPAVSSSALESLYASALSQQRTNMKIFDGTEDVEDGGYAAWTDSEDEPDLEDDGFVLV
jgi:hypothetical protein